MVFTKLGKVVAFLAFALGCLATVLGLYLQANPEGAAEYLSIPLGTRINMNQGFLAICIGVGLGILTDISRSIAIRGDANETRNDREATD